MTIQEIIESIDYCLECENDRIPTTQEDLRIIKEALEKQIPKKPISFKRTAHDFQPEYCKHSGKSCEYIKTYNHEYKYTDYKCPCCKHLCSDGTPNYCWNCGQSLDFGDLNGIY